MKAGPRAGDAVQRECRVTRGDGQRQYCFTLASGDDAPHAESLAAAWRLLEQDMALVPSGETTLVSMTPVMSAGEIEMMRPPRETILVEPLYVDRFAVTNADFAEFVAAGSYQEVDLWPDQILPHVLQFTDSTGRPGPRYWKDGRPPAKKLDHPVVGVSWFEANAYAAWSGKRLPTAAQWQRAGTWPAGDDGSGGQRYPWGNAFDANRANTWSSSQRETVPVNEYVAGCTPNGVYQLIGNVWEWTATRFECPTAVDDLRVVFDQPLAEIRGAAFDTYFETQATCRFASAKPYLHRGANVGFRCCVSAGDLRPPLDPLALVEQLMNE